VTSALREQNVRCGSQVGTTRTRAQAYRSAGGPWGGLSAQGIEHIGSNARPRVIDEAGDGGRAELGAESYGALRSTAWNANGPGVYSFPTPTL